MKKPFFTAAAKRDIRSIWRYIARDSVRYADLVRDAILNTCELTADGRLLGHRRSDLSHRPVLFISVKDYDVYLVAYAAGSDPLKILRVLHGARNFPKQFRS